MDPAPQAEIGVVEEAVALARLAGSATMELYQSAKLSIDTKGDGSPVTEADRAAERLIRQHIQKHHSTDSIIGEEEGISLGASETTWYVDPIDGTRAFVQGVPLFANLIAVFDEHGPLIGVINLPALGETVWAGRGLGCFWNDDACTVSDRSGLDDVLLSTSDYRNMPQDMLKRIHDQPIHLLTWGDAYGYSLVATGRLDAMVDPIVNTWDIAPMATIIPEAGGRFTDLGGDVRVDSGSGLATNGIIHDELLATLTGS